MNECVTDNGGCDHKCSNYPGGFNCSCLDGFDLSEDEHSCTGKYAKPDDLYISCVSPIEEVQCDDRGIYDYLPLLIRLLLSILCNAACQ